MSVSIKKKIISQKVIIYVYAQICPTALIGGNSLLPPMLHNMYFQT